MAITGPEYKCLHADAGSNGRVNDSGTWNKISLLQGIQDEVVKLPDGEKFSNGEVTPYAFLGDDGFARKSFIMKPFPEQGLSRERQVYNYRHSRGRFQKIYVGFSLIDGEYFLPPFEQKYVKYIILTALILHNMLIKRPNSANDYHPASFTDCILEDGGSIRRMMY